MLDNADAPFRLSQEVRDLNDAALSSLSHDIGVGVSDLHMESMGFVWRANGKEALVTGMRFPDYVWDTGVTGGGVVLSVAKGATAVESSIGAVDARARNGMFDQVEPRIGTKTLDDLNVVSGYSFGVCAAGGKDACTAAYEAMDFTGASPSAPGGAPSPSILQSHFGGVFRLLGLDSKDAEADLVEGRMQFATYGDGTMLFLVPELQMPSGRPGPVRSIMFDPATMPALEARVAASALNLRFGVEAASPDKRLEFPRFKPQPEHLPSGVLALAPDGLAVVSTRRRTDLRLAWRPGDGFVRAD
jgi:hypothetical protein